MQATPPFRRALRGFDEAASLRPRAKKRLVLPLLPLAVSAIFALGISPGRAAAQVCTTSWTAQAPSGAACGKVDTAVIAGSAVNGSAFLGIRYAQAPVGRLRWQPPVANSWTGTTAQATRFGSKCMQDSAVANTVKQDSSVIVGSEDCLFLNVFTPGMAKPSGLPVMVFIHGGAFVIGAGSSGLYDGAYMAARGNVVVVTLNYRLGPWGFFSADSAAPARGSDAPGMGFHGNQGLKDQQLALQWVQQNISAFGGDPTQVTVFGESAGAMSVGFHLFAVPSSQPLFRAAIMESNPMGVQYRDAARATTDGNHFLDDLCIEQRSLRCHESGWLQALDSSAVLRAAKKYYGGVRASLARLHAGGLSEALPWTPIVDGSFAVAQPMYGYASVMGAKPFVFGMNRDEGVIFAAGAQSQMGSLFAPPVYNLALKQVFDGSPTGSDSTNEQRIVNYPGSPTVPPPYRATNHASIAGLNATPSALAQLITDFAFACANLSAADTAAKSKAAPVNPSLGAGIFGYRFQQHPFFTLYGAQKACWPTAGSNAADTSNVCHGYELPYVFHTLGFAQNDGGGTGQVATKADSALSDSMVVAWTSFAKNPAAQPASGWTRYAAGGSLYAWTGNSFGQMQGGLATAANCSQLWYTLPPLNGTFAKTVAAVADRAKNPTGG